MNLSGLMALSDVFSFWVDTIFQGSCNPQSLLHGEVDVLFDIPLIGLFKAVRFESYSFHEAKILSILFGKNNHRLFRKYVALLKKY